VAHQYELLKIKGIEWTYCANHIRTWSDYARPQPEHLKWVAYYEPGKYDLALLHIDQQCVLDELGKSQLYRDLRKIIKDIPIIVINHGTPCYPEMIEWEECKKQMRKLVGDVPMVVNSHQAKEDWGWGIPIIHGIDSSEWKDEIKEPRCVTFVSQAGIGTKYYGRSMLSNTKRILKDDYGIQHIWIGSSEYIPHGIEEYKNFIGRSLVYFNPTYGSPMPRSRTEAMLSGSCIVTTRHHDADSFIEDGVNGYICKDNPEDAAKIIADCIKNYKKTVKIGQEGKKTAMKLFSPERFQKNWLDLIHQVLNKNNQWKE